MNVETVILNHKEYFVIEKIEINNNYYYLLINVEDNSDFCIRKKIIENGIEYLVGLDNEQEFDMVLQENLNKKESKKSSKFLPIGTIVKLHDYDKKVMIIGYMLMGKDNIIYDYCGCDYPTGLLNKHSYLYFDRKNIVAISKLGFITEEAKQVLNKVELASASNSLLG